MVESIKDKTYREMVKDRDLALDAKEIEVNNLKSQIARLQGIIADSRKHPISDDEKKTKESLSDYTETIKLMVARMPNRQPLGKFTLYDVVLNTINALDMTRKERDRYVSAWAIFDDAANRAKMAAEGKL